MRINNLLFTTVRPFCFACLAVLFTLLCLGQLPLASNKRLSGGVSGPSHIVGIAHYSYYVGSLARARVWYQQFLGFDQAFSIRDAFGRVRVAYFKINDHQFIELYPLRPGMSQHYGWLHDVGFQSDNIRATRSFLAARGVRGLSPIGRDPAGDREFSFLDPSGFNIEVVQYLPGSLTGKTAGHFLSGSRVGDWIDHVGLLQKSRRRAARFYRAFLDSPTGVRGHKLTIARGRARFEIGWQRKPPVEARFHIKDHVCIRVARVPHTVARLEAEPVYRQFWPIETHQLSNGKHVAELYDPYGNRIELMEPAPPQTAAIEASAKAAQGGYEVLTRLPPGHHALLERLTRALRLSYRQELLIEPRLHAEEAVSQPLLRFSAFTPTQKKAVMLKLKLAARRNLLPLLTVRQRRLLQHDIAELARTGKEKLGERRGKRKTRRGKHSGRIRAKRRKRQLAPLPLAQSEPLLSHAIRGFAAFTPAQKRAMLLRVKRAALRHANELGPGLLRRLRRQVQKMTTGQ